MSSQQYAGRHCVVTGGLGFIGSNLALRLLAEGAVVTVIDSSVAGCGANVMNLAPFADSLRILHCDIGDTEQLRAALDQPDFVFNLAGEISHSVSMSHPERDLEINTRAQLRFVLLCRDRFPGIRIVYASTRQVYGIPHYLPADEGHPIEPIDFNGIHKNAATQYHLLLSRRGELDCIVLRLSNVYGPRMALNQPQQGVLNVYLNAAIAGRPLTIYGEGNQLRDPVYVGDVVDAFLQAGLASTAKWRIYNVGGREALTVGQIAETLTRVARLPPPVRVAFPDVARSIDIGSYVSDCRRAESGLGWVATTELEAGIGKALDYYTAYESSGISIAS